MKRLNKNVNTDVFNEAARLILKDIYVPSKWGVIVERGVKNGKPYIIYKANDEKLETI